MTLSEQVARAINPDRGEPTARSAGGKFLGDEHALQIADAAIAVIYRNLRKPSEEMLEAAWQVLRNEGDFEDDMKGCFAAMFATWAASNGVKEE